MGNFISLWMLLHAVVFIGTILPPHWNTVQCPLLLGSSQCLLLPRPPSFDPGANTSATVAFGLWLDDPIKHFLLGTSVEPGFLSPITKMINSHVSSRPCWKLLWKPGSLLNTHCHVLWLYPCLSSSLGSELHDAGECSLLFFLLCRALYSDWPRAEAP